MTDPCENSIYLPDATYEALKMKLAALIGDQPDRADFDPVSEVVTALGEIGNVWPEFVRGDV